MNCNDCCYNLPKDGYSYCTYEEGECIKISILEKENAELKTQVKTAYRKGMRHIAKALKDYDRTDGAWTDYFEHTVDKVLQREQTTFEEYGTLSDQLTKAKEIIKKISEFVNNGIEYDPEHPQEHTDLWNKLCEETEQFLNCSEKPNS